MYTSTIPCWSDNHSHNPENVDAMVQQGVVEPVQSKCSSLLLLVLKSKRSWQIYIDYRRFNSTTIQDTYTIPRQMIAWTPLVRQHGLKPG